MATSPGQSLPVQHQRWADLKAAYRFLDNPRITPVALQIQHRQLCVRAASRHPVILCVQDGSNIAGARVAGGQWVMHSGLAVTPGGEVLGLLDQQFYKRVKKKAKESRKARQKRFRESDVWVNTVNTVGPMHTHQGGRVVHVCDRAADDLRLMFACCDQQTGFVIRACRDRSVEQATDKLWSHLSDVAVSGQIEIEIGHQQFTKLKTNTTTRRIARPARSTLLQVRFATVQLWSPAKGGYDRQQLQVNVVYLKEPGDTPNPVEWMLLTNLPVETLADALTIVDYYRIRWVIEQWHRALKEGCRLHESQLQSIENLIRLISILSVVAVRLLQLRDWANTPNPKPAQAQLDLQHKVPQPMLKAAAALNDQTVDQMTPQLFWKTLAAQGGWLGRTRDPHPGWKAIWTGWQIIARIAQGLDLAELLLNKQTCG